MPTAPNPLNPDFPRAPGMPRINGLPTPRPSPVTPLNQVGLASGVPGRPPATPTPAGVGAPSPAPSGTAFPPAPPQGFPSAPAPAPAPPPSPVAPPGQPTAPGQPPAYPGQPVQSALGTVAPDASGRSMTTLSPEGAQKYQQMVVMKRKELGAVPKFAQMPGAPELPVQLGSSNFNPWTGRMFK